MDTVDVTDQVRLRCGVSVAFGYFVSGELLSSWWPKSARIDARLHGKVHLEWFSGGSLDTSFSSFEIDRVLAMDFYNEYLEVHFAENDGGTVVKILHRVPYREGDLEGVIHVAQSWSFLLANLKSVVENKYDLRERPNP